jgi:signal transduction histidine kinase
MNYHKKFKYFVGALFIVIPPLTLISDIHLISEHHKYFYMAQKIFFSLFATTLLTSLCIKNPNKFFNYVKEYYNEALFTATLLYTAINTYFISGYSLMYYQCLAGCTIFLQVNRKIYLSVTAIATLLLIYLLSISTKTYFTFANPAERYLFDSGIGILIFSTILLVGKYYLDKEMQKKKDAELLVEAQNKKILEQKEKLEITMEDKTTLLHTLLHDITTPIQLILLNQKYLINEDQEVRMKSSQKVSKYTENIVEILNNIRKIEALKSGKQSLDLQPTSIIESVEDALELFEAKLSLKNISIKFNNLLSKNTYAICEKQSFVYSVVGNLISNAIKFSANGSTITINSFEVEDNIHLEIVDRGIGIPPMILNNIYSRYYETTRKGTQGESGTGFGMPLVKAFVNKYGGSLEIQSRCEKEFKENSGTRITIILKKYKETYIPLTNSFTSQNQLHF